MPIGDAATAFYVQTKFCNMQFIKRATNII